MPYIYVLAPDGHPLMPTRRRRHVKKLLNSGKARIAAHIPFTIQLKYQTPEICQPLTLGIDPGRTNIGCAAIESKGRLVYSAVCETRNKEISKLMDERRQHRRASRNGERKRRQRRARKYGTMLQAGCVMRRLPHYDTEIMCRWITNTEARFCNRKRPVGWLTPTVEQLVRTHVNLFRKVSKILPITDAAIEINRFAFARMEDPSITGLDFQNGPLKGYTDVKAAVADQQKGLCLLCGRAKISRYHHIIPRYRNGSESLDNRAGLCDSCHEKVHKDVEAAGRLAAKKQGMMKKYHALSALNQAIPYICSRLSEAISPEHLYFTTGRDTSEAREGLSIRKDWKASPCHDADAYLIACNGMGITPESVDFKNSYRIKQYRRHDRQLIHAQRERAYRLDGKTVARNRRKRTEQQGDSLHEWYLKTKALIGRAGARRLQKQMKVAPSTRYYKNPKRLMPGTVFIARGKRYVICGQLSNGMYLRAEGCGTENFPIRDCRILRQNGGLVYVA